jgi:hypothetical protein
LVPKAPIHTTGNVRSYEYGFAGRTEHYWGEIGWDLAWPLLQKRFGMVPPR